MKGPRFPSATVLLRLSPRTVLCGLVLHGVSLSSLSFLTHLVSPCLLFRLSLPRFLIVCPVWYLFVALFCFSCSFVSGCTIRDSLCTAKAQNERYQSANERNVRCQRMVGQRARDDEDMPRSPLTSLEPTPEGCQACCGP
ncbi:hypothetical protein BGW80DRAFT_591711 [Lactifluus volemus]|nr:hypothetical protein BGW80DRAFT_591711 [Lactifluus volemus]